MLWTERDNTQQDFQLLGTLLQEDSHYLSLDVAAQSRGQDRWSKGLLVGGMVYRRASLSVFQ